jgi:hypothetical protein
VSIPYICKEPVQCKKKKKRGLGSFARLFLYHLERGGGERIRHYLAPPTCGSGGGAP